MPKSGLHNRLLTASTREAHTVAFRGCCVPPRGISGQIRGYAPTRNPANLICAARGEPCQEPLIDASRCLIEQKRKRKPLHLEGSLACRGDAIHRQGSPGWIEYPEQSVPICTTTACHEHAVHDILSADALARNRHHSL